MSTQHSYSSTTTISIIRVCVFFNLFKGCQTGTGAIVRGDQCCQLLFQDQVKLGPDGVCLVGGAEQLAKLSFEPKFPIAPRPFSIAKLTVVLRMSSRIPVDHR